MNPQPLPEEDYQPKTWWNKLRDGLLGADEPDDDETDIGAIPQNTAGQGARKQGAPLRMQTARAGKVNVRLNAQVFEDAKLAADGLKSGQQQIVNLERATHQMAERIIDFLNGVCYALDGTVERVGDKVYMFVPANVEVEVDTGATAVDSASARTKPAFGAARE